MSRLVSFSESEQILLAISDVWQRAVNDHVPKKSWHLVLKPTFALNDDMHEWGRWTGGMRRLMEIKTQLVLDHPWYAVVDVVLHETAHQMVLQPAGRESDGVRRLSAVGHADFHGGRE